MKQKLLILLLSIFVTSSVLAQISAGQVDDFEDGTVLGWKHKLANPDSPVNVITDGPAGVDDNFLRNSNNGVDGTPGAKHIMFNSDIRWQGNFTAQGIVAIRMDVRNSGANDLHLRVAFRGGPNVSWMASTNAVIVSTGGGWSTLEVPILNADFTITQGSDAVADILLDVIEMRILSNDGSQQLHKGDLRVQRSEYDNIAAFTSLLSVKSNTELTSFLISPNPGRDRLNLKLSKLSNNTSLEVFDVLGKKIFANRLTNISSSVDVSKWSNGVYLVRIKTDTGTQTKRFVKR